MSGPRTVLVTGAGGLVGGAVARALAARGWAVAALYRKSFPEALADLANVTLIQADLRSASGLPDRYDALVHCAAEVPALCPDEDELYRSNVEGTQAVFRHAAAAGARRVVYCSSMAVYGTIEAEVVDDATPLRDAGVYGRSKLAGERLLAALTAEGPDRRGVSIRLPGVVGAGSRNNFLSDALRQILAGNAIEARNPEALFNNIVHVSDLAGFVGHLLQHMPEGHRATTMAADGPEPIREVVATLFREAGRPEQVTYGRGGRPFLISPEPARALGYAVPGVRDSLVRFVRDNLAGSGAKASGCAVDRLGLL